MTFSIYSNGSSDAYAQGYAGGGVGDNSGTVSNCSVKTNITTQRGDGYRTEYVFIGGFVARNSGTVIECSAEGEINIPSGDFNEYRIGGFVFENQSNINNSYAMVSITTLSAPNSTYSCVGGFAAINDNVIANCYSTGDINTKATRVGGFVGYNNGGASITKSFCIGNVNGGSKSKYDGTDRSIGYFVGSAEAGSSLFKCYYNKNMTMKVDNYTTTPNNTDGTAATVAELQNNEMIIDTLSWSEEIWSVQENAYPIFVWQLPEE